MPLSTVTVVGAYIKPNGQPAGGRVEFQLSGRAVDTTNGLIVSTTPIVGKLDGSGEFSVVLVATDQPSFNPTKLTFRVTEHIEGSEPESYSIEVPVSADGGTVNLKDVSPVAPTVHSENTSYVLQSVFLGHIANDIHIGQASALPISVTGLVSTNTEAAIAEVLEQQELQVEPGQTTPVEIQGSVSSLVWTDGIPLAADETRTFPGSGRLDVGSPTSETGRWAALIGTVDTDQDCTLFLDWYVSEAGALIRSDSIAVTGGTPTAVHHNIPHTHLSIRLVNGPTPQTRLEASLSGTIVTRNPEQGPAGPAGPQGEPGADGAQGPAGPDAGITNQFLDADVSTTTDASLTTIFTLPVLAGERYALDMELSYTGETAADLALRITCPAGSTARFWTLKPAAGAANTNSPQWQPHTSGDSTTCGAMGGSTEAPAWTKGTLTAGADGNVTVQVGQAFAHATPSVVKRAGSHAQWSKKL